MALDSVPYIFASAEAFDGLDEGTGPGLDQWE